MTVKGQSYDRCQRVDCQETTSACHYAGKRAKWLGTSIQVVERVNVVYFVFAEKGNKQKIEKWAAAFGTMIREPTGRLWLRGSARVFTALGK